MVNQLNTHNMTESHRTYLRMQMFGNIAQANGCVSTNAALLVLGLHSGKMAEHLDVQIVVVQFGRQMNDGLL